MYRISNFYIKLLICYIKLLICYYYFFKSMLFWHKILSFSFVHITKFVFYLIFKHIFVDIMSNIEQGNFINTTIGEFVF